jgi:hypothetical protein
MNSDQIREWYLTLPESKKQVFLAMVSNYLTVCGRDFEHFARGEQQIRGFIGLNELQHQISGHIAGLGLGRDRYPDDVLWKILDEKAAAYGLSSHLEKALAFARSRDLWSEPS